jgi:S1-C subfamily serine protease
MNKNLKISTAVLLLTLVTSCASVFIPKRQKVAFKTNNSENEVFLDNEFLGKGKAFNVKIDKTTTTGQIVVTRKGYKSAYDVILKNRRPDAFWPLQIPNLCFGYYGFLIDYSFSSKCKAYEKELITNCPDENLLPLRTEKDKFINVSNIRLDIKDKNKDLVEITLNSYNNQNLLKDIALAEKNYYDNLKKKQVKEDKKNRTKKDTKKLVSDEYKNEIKTDDTEYSNELFKTLKTTKFIDTVNKIFNDQNNTIVLEGAIKKITAYNIGTKMDFFFKAKIDITWYIRNTYEEILDSIVTSEFSGNFATIYDNNSDNKYSGFAKMLGDAISISYIKLHKNKTFINSLKLNKDFKIKDELLVLNSIPSQDRVSSKIDGFKASVIVKTKENNKDAGHGSGFAITKDGYILTNYHVIAGRHSSKQKEITIITSSGEELSAKIVKFNRYRDVAILKVDYKFDKAFYLSSENKSEVMQDVYTIGAPKSIELGQSVSIGIISAIRDVNDNKYLQLGMAINAGNSGGSIFDQQGNLHGVVVSKLVGYSTEGVGFAIPSFLVPSYLNISYN